MPCSINPRGAFFVPHINWVSQRSETFCPHQTSKIVYKELSEEKCMSIKFYSNERNVQILISLMKAHNIRRVVASPGTTNLNVIASLQHDPFFEIFSCVDERSAAYMACGIAAETQEPVALSCTGATASRNYVPGLTEAFYRKLPVLAITSTQHAGNIGQMIPQVIDRSVIMKDIAKLSVNIPTINSSDDEWACNVAINRALLSLKYRGGGPVHINIATTYDQNFSQKILPPTRVISRINIHDAFPSLCPQRIGIFVGAHLKWSSTLVKAIEKFCELYNAVVLCDHTSNYPGKYRVFPAIACSQFQATIPCCYFDLLIHIGEVSGAYFNIFPKNVWRVSIDGNIPDSFKKLTYVFDMEEEDFFLRYCSMIKESRKLVDFYAEWNNQIKSLITKIPELPFSNLWVAQQTATLLPKNSKLHLGILNSLRSWNFFETDPSILGYSNTGGFGIDGGMSSFIGASLVDTNKLFFMIIGDLAFFYDINVLGNRHIKNNIRIVLINNGVGAEFKRFNHPAYAFGKNADTFMAAAGHFGSQSRSLIKHIAQDLGFLYFSASNKTEYMQVLPKLTSATPLEKPLIVEVFTQDENESEALKKLSTIEITTKGAVKDTAKKLLGPRGIQIVKQILK